MSELGDLLKQLRGKRSLRDVAGETDLSHTYISDLEKGKRRGTNTPLHPSVDTLKRLAKAYHYPLKKLLIAAGYWEEEDNGEEMAITLPTIEELISGKANDYDYDALEDLTNFFIEYKLTDYKFAAHRLQDFKKDSPRTMAEQKQIILRDYHEQKGKNVIVP